MEEIEKNRKEAGKGMGGREGESSTEVSERKKSSVSKRNSEIGM